MNDKEELIKKLGSLVKKHTNSGITHNLSYTMKRWELELVTDYILEFIIPEERKQIVQPLIDYSNNPHNIETYEKDVANAMIETLKRAGIDS